MAATGHAVSASAIAKGLKARQAESKKPVYWIQISGATVYAAEEIASSSFGRASNVIYDDVKDQDKILSIIRGNSKRVVENTVLSQPPSAIRTAIIPGPLIYGVGRGPVNQRSVQAPEIARAVLKLGHGFELGDGENAWSNIHVQDVASLVVLLVSAAIEGKDGIWHENGIYNVENGALVSYRD
jgi:nucleoside-diphosphate-sugar epimerase